MRTKKQRIGEKREFLQKKLTIISWSFNLIVLKTRYLPFRLHIINVLFLFLYFLSWHLRLDKFFPSLDPKIDSKIVWLDLLRVAVVFLFFYLSLKLFLSIISIDHKASIIIIIVSKAWLEHFVRSLVLSGPTVCVSARSERVNKQINKQTIWIMKKIYSRRSLLFN